MPSNTTFANLHLYDRVDDREEKFIEFRDDLAGTKTDSNMQKIDIILETHGEEINNINSEVGLQRGKINNLTSISELHGSELAIHDENIGNLNLAISGVMPAAPVGEHVYAGNGQTWQKLEGTDVRAVIMINNNLQVIEEDGLITIDSQEFEDNDLFTISYNGAQVTFDKNSNAKELYQFGANSILYKFIFNTANKSISILEQVNIDTKFNGINNSIDSLNEKKANIAPTAIDVTTNLHTLAPGIYSVGSDAFSTNQNYPAPISNGQFYNLLIEVLGYGFAGDSNGYKVIRLTTSYNDVYIKTQSWSTWRTWRKLSYTAV